VADIFRTGSVDDKGMEEEEEEVENTN